MLIRGLKGSGLKGSMWDAIAQQIEPQIEAITGQPFRIKHWKPVSGGCINEAFCIGDGMGDGMGDGTGDSQRYLVKLNQAGKAAMFEAEALGLQEMTAAGCIRVPRPLCWGTVSTRSYLVLEWINFGQGTARQSGRSPNWSAMGQQLAALHRSSAQGFGWHRDNTIGETPQPNPWTVDWANFFAEWRIGFQLKLAARNGGRFADADALLSAIPELLAGHDPQPSLVHGDLWSGNAAFDASGMPVLFDPATYYGDREVDLAMTSLFGGFPEAFYQGYLEAWPLPSGYQQRKGLYNLYHVLNHFNLFGGSYFSQAQQMIRQLLGRV